MDILFGVVLIVGILAISLQSLFTSKSKPRPNAISDSIDEQSLVSDNLEFVVLRLYEIPPENLDEIAWQILRSHASPIADCSNANT